MTAGADAPVEWASGPEDPRLEDFRDLTDVSRRRTVEPAGGFFIAEGAWVIERALSAGYPLRRVVVEPRWLEALALPAGAPVLLGERPLLEAVTGYHVHRGALASFGRLPLPTPEELVRRSSRLLLLEQVNNPTNVGAVARAAAGLGWDGVLVDPLSADPLYRRSVRVSMGAVLQLPHARVPSAAEAAALLVAAGFRLLALTPAADARPLDDVRPGVGERVALLLGAEGPGLSPELLARAEPVRIPMRAGVDSLNVAAAAAVACYALGPRDDPPSG